MCCTLSKGYLTVCQAGSTAAFVTGIPVSYSFDYILHVCFQWGMPRGVISYEQKMHAEQKQQIKADMPKVF